MANKSLTIYKRGSKSPDAKTVSINCLGDSITFGVGSNTDPADEINKNGTYRQYHRCWEEQYDVKVANCGESGACVAKYDVKKGYLPNNSRAFVLRAPEMPENADIITIMGGVNDCQAGYFPEYEFGSVSDPSNTEINTFCGAVRTTVKAAREKNPDALIVYLSPLKFGDKPVNGLLPPWRFQPLLPMYVDAVKALCNELDIHFIDCYTPEELDFVNNDDDPEVYGDRLHFGWKGHEILSKFIIKKLVNDGLIEIKD